MREQEFCRYKHDVSLSEWWKVSCMALDVQDYMAGDLSKKDFIEYMLVDLEELTKKVRNLENPE